MPDAGLYWNEINYSTKGSHALLAHCKSCLMFRLPDKRSCVMKLFLFLEGGGGGVV